jgi:hypothetical protein
MSNLEPQPARASGEFAIGGDLHRGDYDVRRLPEAWQR